MIDGDSGGEPSGSYPDLWIVIYFILAVTGRRSWVLREIVCRSWSVGEVSYHDEANVKSKIDTGGTEGKNV